MHHTNQNRMKQILFGTENLWVGLILRLSLGFIMLPHGMQKLFGAFGGFGYKATMNFFTESMKLPWIISLAVILIEFFGSVGLVVGFASRIWAAGFIIIMTGAILTTNAKFGLFMNWFGNQEGEGFEYHLLVIGMCIALFIAGSGNYSIDQLIKAD